MNLINKYEREESAKKSLKFYAYLSMVFCVLFSALYMAQFENSLEKHVVAAKQVVLEALHGEFFDPIKKDDMNWFYQFGPGAGLNKGVFRVSGTIGFQDFQFGNNSVQRLWADPNSNIDQSCYIKAQNAKVGDNHFLKVEFNRQGKYGCDLTIRPSTGGAVFVDPNDYKFLCIEMEQVNCKMSDSDSNNVAFRIRLVDGRGTHWVWGEKNKSSTLMEAYIDYSHEASKVIKSPSGVGASSCMVLSNEKKVFYFDINDKSKWEVFDADGGIAPPDRNKFYFDFISTVLICLDTM